MQDSARKFLGDTERVVLWPALLGLIDPRLLEQWARRTPANGVERMLRMSFLQWLVEAKRKTVVAQATACSGN